MTVLLAAVSVDLDGISYYQKIHGLAALPDEARALHAVYDVALERMHAFARAHELPLTLFTIGEDLERRENAEALRRLVSFGHAIGNHSLSHRYDLTRLPRDAIQSEIDGGKRAIEEALGVTPRGFRAPGYTVSDEVLDVLEELSIAYDSSVFPCPAYYSAKAAVMGAMRLFGRTSSSVLDTPRVLTAPTRPYRPGTFFGRGHRRLIELPIQVTRGLRLPFIGTTIALAGSSFARVLAHQVKGEPLVNLELHGIDFLDASDGLEHLVPYQRELKIPLSRRLDALSAAVSVIRESGASFVTLDEAADHFAQLCG